MRMKVSRASLGVSKIQFQTWFCWQRWKQNSPPQPPISTLKLQSFHTWKIDLIAWKYRLTWKYRRVFPIDGSGGERTWGKNKEKGGFPMQICKTKKYKGDYGCFKIVWGLWCKNCLLVLRSEILIKMVVKIHKYLFPIFWRFWRGQSPYSRYVPYFFLYI